MFKKLILNSTYKYVYGKKAKVVINEDTVEVFIGNKKVIHNKDNNMKVEEYLYNSNEVTLIKYDAQGNVDNKEIYVNGQKISEVTSDGKTTSFGISEDNFKVFETTYSKDGSVVVEKRYVYVDSVTLDEYEVIVSNQNEVVKKRITKKNSDTVLIDVERQETESGKLLSYNDFVKNMEVNIDYYFKTRNIEKLSIYKEEPVYELVTMPAGKSKKKDKEPIQEKKQVGTQIAKQIIEYNSNGRIVFVETNSFSIVKEFLESGLLKKQYKIIDTEHGKEIVGKLILDDEVKIINNSKLTDVDVDKINSELDAIDAFYDNLKIDFIDFMEYEKSIIIVNDVFKASKKMELVSRNYDKIENNVDYHIEESYMNSKLFSTRKTNKITYTELYSEPSKFIIKCMNGEEKEVTKEEFELYKMADELNTIE